MSSLDLLDLGAGDQFFEERYVFGDALARGVGSGGDRRIAERNDAVLDLVLRHHRQRRFGETLKELRRRPGRREQKMLGLERDVGKASFLKSRHVGQVDPACLGGDGKPAHHAGLHLRLRAGERGQQQIDGAGEQRLRRRPAAIERNIGNVEPRL